MADPQWLLDAQREGRVKSVAVNVGLLSPPTPGRLPLGLDQMSEKEFQVAVCDLAHSLGWRVAHFRKVRVQRAGGETFWETPVAEDGKGWPDLVLVKPPFRPIFAELKVKANVPSPEQWQWLHELRGSGMNAVVLYPSDWPFIVDMLTNGSPQEAALAAQEVQRFADDGNPHLDAA